MNILLFHSKEILHQGILKLQDHRHQHIKKILKAKVGQQLTVGKLNGNIGNGEIVYTDTTETHLRIDLTTAPPPPLPIKLIFAMPRPKVLKRVIYNATTMGVKDFHIFNSWRVEKSFWKSPVVENDALTKYMIEGLEQAKDTQLPQITFHRFFKNFVQDSLPHLSQNTDKLIAHPYGLFTPKDCVCPSTSLIVGPEGGFIEKEIETFEQQGFNKIQIGSRILKVETAITSLISKFAL